MMVSYRQNCKRKARHILQHTQDAVWPPVINPQRLRFRSHQVKVKVTSLNGCCCFQFNYSHQAMSKIKEKNHIRFRLV